VGKAIDAGVDSFLIADPAFLIALRKANINAEIHLSTGTTVLNSEAVKFFQDLGVSRVTLERQLTLNEIREIVENISGIETCVFILNSRCPNVDGLCTFMHVQFSDPSYKNACMLPYSVRLSRPRAAGETEEEKEDKELASQIKQQVWARYHMDEIPCGACALYDFEEIGLNYAKIVGRGNQTWRKVKDIEFIRLLLALLKDKNISRQKYIERARALYSYTYGFSCQTIRCYYPEVITQERILV